MPRNKRNKLGLNNSLIRTRDRGIIEDDTEYGEFISSFDAWMTPDEQRQRVDYLEDLKGD